MQNEAGTRDVIDPWGGSYYVERLTADLASRAWEHIQEVETIGGMSKAIEMGLPKARIEKAAAEAQARIDSGRQSVIGVNKYRLADEAEVDILKVDNSAVRASQIEKLKNLKADRDETRAQSGARCAVEIGQVGEGNLLDLAVKAARAHATVGEISAALEKVWGRHQATIISSGGVYAHEMEGTDTVPRVRRLAETFERLTGERPRILVAKLGQDGHDRGQKVIASAFSDLGFDVVIGPLFATPEEAAEQAIKNKVHIVGVSSLAAGHLTLVPELKRELEKRGSADIMLVVGGTIPAGDHAALEAAGVEGIFPPGTNIADAAESLVRKLAKRMGRVLDNVS